MFSVEPRVLSPRNIVNILNQSSYLVLFASAQMIVILTRGFDLSLGTTVSAVSVASALAMTSLASAGVSDAGVVAAGTRRGPRLRRPGRTLQRRLRLEARDQSVHRHARQPQHLHGPRHDDVGRASGLQRARRFQRAALQRRADSRGFDPADAGDRGLPAAVFSARSHDIRPLALSDRQQSRAPPISRACRAGAISPSPMSCARCWPRSAR